MNELTVSGTPYECGYRMGETFRQQIEKRQRALPGDPDVRSQYLAFQAAMLRYMERHFRDLVEEITGIAEGARLDFDAAFYASTFNAIAPAASRSCSSVGFIQSNVGPILGKTDDGGLSSQQASPEAEKHREEQRLSDLVILRSAQANGHALLGVTPAGTVWSECGINEKGFCLGSSSGQPTFRAQDGYGVPQHIACRLLLRYCATVAEAIEFFQQYKLAGKGINITVLDAEGNAAGIEACFTMSHVRQAKNDVVFTTNHYNGPEMLKAGVLSSPAHFASVQFQNSLNRFIGLQAEFHGSKRPLSLERMKRAISSHRSPGAICQHFDNNDAYMHTSFGAIMIAQKATMLFNAGHPCRGEYATYTL